MVGGATYYGLFYTPKNSLELYRALAFADYIEWVKKLMLEGYEGNLKNESYPGIEPLLKHYIK